MADSTKFTFRGETAFYFSELGDYIWKMRKQLDALVVKEKERTLEGFSGETLRIRQFLESRKHDYVFPNALHYSFIVLLFITIEDQLKRTCDLIQVSNKLPLRAKDLRGDSLEQSMIFLDKLAGIPRNELAHWPKISDLSKVRHCIVHTSGHIEFSRDKKYLIELVKMQPDLLRISDHQVPEDRVLIVEHAYCMLNTTYATDFFEEIFEKAGIV